MSYPSPYVAQPEPQAGDIREGAAEQAGDDVAGIMADAQTAILALIATAVTRKAIASLTGTRFIRQVLAIITVALSHAYQVIDAHAQRQNRLTHTAVTRQARRALDMPGLPNTEQVKQEVRRAALDVYAQARAIGRQVQKASAIDALARIDQGDSEARMLADRVAAARNTGKGKVQSLLDDLARSGITAFTDSSGRPWSLPAYAQMLVRTAVSRQAIAAQFSMMDRAGLDLVLVVEITGQAPCRKCAPFVGRVLSASGSTHAGTSATITDSVGNRRQASVLTTVTDAVARGLLHPQCRHTLMPYVDGMGSANVPLLGSSQPFVHQGVTIHRVVAPRADSPQYVAEQKRRAAELAVRTALTLRKVATTPDVRHEADRRIAAARATLADIVANLPKQVVPNG